MECLFIAGYETSARAAKATGRMTDEGARREDLSLVTGAEGAYRLDGEGVLAARLRLGKEDASLLEGLRWIGLDDERAGVLVGLLEQGGGVLVLAAPTAGLSVEAARASLLDESPAAFTSVRILSSWSSESPSLRVHTTVGSEPASLSLHTLRERIAIERRTVRRAASAEDLELFRDATYEFKETAQVLEVRTVPYVVEEAVVTVDRYLEEREVIDRIAKLKLEVEEL